MKYIQDRKLPAGASLPSELMLARTFGVSRPVVREALRALQGRSVVNLVNGKRAVVRPLDGKAFNDFFLRAMAESDFEIGVEMEEARNGLETQCAFLAATRRTDEQVRQLEEILGEMRVAIEKKKVYWHLNMSFHKTIAEASGNRLLHLLVGSLQDALDHLMEKAKDDDQPIHDGLWSAMHPYHELIFEHIRDRNAAKAATATFEHLELALKITRSHTKSP